MMLEHALLHVSAGREQEFERSMAEALPIIESAPTVTGARFDARPRRSIYLLLVRWSSVEAHLAFRRSELFERWRLLTHHFYSETPSVTHFHDPLAR